MNPQHARELITAKYPDYDVGDIQSFIEDADDHLPDDEIELYREFESYIKIQEDVS